MKNKRGMSLIILIITIIVVIILAAVVILTISKNNPLNSAKEATFKEDIRNFQDELALYVSNEILKDYSGMREKINTSENPNVDEIKNYISNFTKKYEGKLGIEEDELVFFPKEVTKEEKKWLEDLGIKAKTLKETDESEFTWGSDELDSSDYGTIIRYKGFSKDIVIPQRCKKISEYAFMYNSNIETITITDNVERIPITPRPFLDHCVKFSKIYVTEGNSKFSSSDGILFNKDKTSLLMCPLNNDITSYIVPNSVKSIGDESFRGCKSLINISIPNSVTWLGGNAFSGCNGLTSITIPESVITIRDERIWCIYIC